MYRLLIVDDEPIIVNGLVELFSEPNDLNLEIYWAYSSFEATEKLTKTKIDIVLSDIRMPLKSGLELQKEIMLQWPRCKVIFLTGYNDFAFVQEAMRCGSVDYVLKTEGDEKILETVENAIESLKKEAEVDLLIQEAKRQIFRALPSLQKEFLWDLLQGDPYSLQTMPKQFSNLQIKLDAKASVLLVLGRVDNWKQDISPSDRLRLLYAIQNIAEEYISVSSSVFSIVYDRSKLVWLIQPQIQDKSSEEYIAESWKRTILFVHGMLESIQSTCKDLLSLPISFVAASEPVGWKDTAEKFEALKSVFSQGFGMSTELLLIENDLYHHDPQNTIVSNGQVRLHLKKIDLLKTYLENGHKTEFFELYLDFMNTINVYPSHADTLKIEIYYSLFSIFLSQLNRHGLQKEMNDKLEFNKFSPMEHNSWGEVIDYFSNLAEILFEHQVNERTVKGNEYITKVEGYIKQNVSGDLSLACIGEAVGLNPSYLSRLYKQATGQGLSSLITEARMMTAKALLQDKKYKIHEISKHVGFVSDHHFYRFFKKAMNMTPQEYRESVN